jgi:tetratricopeptide (TPR) repeat protein
MINPKRFIFILLVSSGVFSLAWGLIIFVQNIEGRMRPIKIADSESFSIKEDKKLDTLRAKVVLQGGNEASQLELATLLINNAKISTDKVDKAKYMSEAFGILQSLALSEPKDPDIFLYLGDLAFDMQRFEVAKTSFSKFLQLKPNENATRIKLGSTLTFLGEFKQAKKELFSVLVKEPENFQANAFLFINYAQQGKIKTAIEYGDKALSFAPNQEAKDRLNKYLISLKENLNKNDSHNNSNWITTVSNFLQKHPMLNQKFMNIKTKDKILSITIRNFPMQVMPDGVKDIFIGKISALIPKDEIIKIEFIDGDSGKIMLARKI